MFKTGDKVTIVGGSESDIRLIVDPRGVHFRDPTCRVWSKLRGFTYIPARRLVLYEEPWTPKQGEMIEVKRKSDTFWYQKKFCAFDKKLAICITGRPEHYFGWECYRQLQHTVSFDGEAPISVTEDVFTALKAKV